MSITNKSELLMSRDGTTDFGKPYEQKIPALFGVKCIFNSDIKDFKMASNVAGLGAFDDLVLFIESISYYKKLYLVQIKYKENKPIYYKTLTSNNKHFGLDKYEQNFLDIRKKFYSGSLPVLSQWCEFNDITFVIFTNTKLNDCSKGDTTIIIDQEKKSEILNTGEIYKIRNGQSGTYDTDFLKQFYLYCKQTDVSQIGKEIKIEVEKQNFKDVDVDKAITDYFTDWSLKLFKNKPMLTKMDIEYKLLEELLTEYIYLPTVSGNFQNVQTWNDVTEEFNIVSLANKKHLSKVWYAVQRKVNEYLGDESIKFENWNGLVEEPSVKINNANLMSCKNLSIKTDNCKVKDFFKLLWGASKIPLILNLNTDRYSQENVQSAISKFDSDYKLRYIFFGYGSLRTSKAKNFINLNCISNNNQITALRCIRLCLQNRKSISLKELYPNNNVLDKITPDIFLDLLENNITSVNKAKSKYYISRYLKKPLISLDVLSQKNAIFFLIGKFKQIRTTLSLMCSCSRWESYRRNDFRNILNQDTTLITVIYTEELIMTYNDIIEVIKEIKRDQGLTVHFLKINTENNLEWLYSNQCISMIKPFRIQDEGEHCILSDENLFSCLNFHILSDTSGEGKTMLLQYLKDNCPPDKWMIYLNIKECREYIQKGEFSEMKRFLYEKSEKNCYKMEIFYWELFKNLLISLKVLIAIDGLDEIKYDKNTEKFLNEIKGFGTPTLLTTRPTLKNILEDKFNSLSFCFRPFSKNDQKLLIYNILEESEKKLSEDQIGQVINKLTSLTNKFIAIPLQTELFGRIMESKSQINLADFDISDLYEKYIETRLNKVNMLNKATFRTLSRLALLQFYQTSKIAQLLNIEEFYDDLDDKKEKLIESKIIQKIEQVSATFSHKSLAEYLAAKCLHDLLNPSKYSVHDAVRPLLKCLFYRELEIVRVFFDKIILKNCWLHRAVLENDGKLFGRLVSEKKCDEDSLGRNVLHIAASYGKYNELRTQKTLCSDINIVESYNESFLGLIIPCDENPRAIEVSIELVKNLLKYDLDLHRKDKLFNMTVFDFAIQSSSLEVLEVLLASKGPKNLDQEFIDKDMLLYYSIKGGFSNIFKEIEKKNFKLKHILTGENLLHIALRSENLEIISEIIDNIDDIDEPDLMGNTPFISWLSSLKLNSLEINSVLHDNSMRSTSKLNKNQLKLFHSLVGKVNVNQTNRFGQAPLHIIASLENISLIKSIISFGADINRKSIVGQIPLHFASLQSLENVTILVTNNTVVDSVDEFGCSPLCYAAFYNKPDIIEYLIEIGSNVNNNEGTIPPLIMAAFEGHIECVRVLIEKKADVNREITIEEEKICTLSCAVVQGHLQCAMLIIQAGAKISGDKQFILLKKAAENGHSKIFDYLVSQGCDMNFELNEYTLLHSAVSSNDIEYVKLLLSKGFDINMKNKFGVTPLQFTTMLDLSNMLNFLISNGADINVGENWFFNPLIVAAKNNSLQCIEILISIGCDIDEYGSYALYSAARNGYHEITDALLKAGTNINKRWDGTISPIEEATREGNLTCVKVLVSKGADINLKGSLGRTPLMVAAGENHISILDYLLSKGADLYLRDNHNNTVLHIAVWYKIVENIKATRKEDFECINILVAKGVDINLKGNLGRTPLILAAKKVNVPVLNYLLSLGADLNIKDDLNNTVLHSAVWRNQTESLDATGVGALLEFVTILLAKGADINAKGHLGRTPIMLAAQNDDIILVLKYLLSKGADLNIRDDENTTLLHLVVWLKKLEVLKAIFERDVNIATTSNEENTGIFPMSSATTDVCSNSPENMLSIDINSRMVNGYTALMIAVLVDDVTIMKYLLSHGADVNVKDNGGFTVLHLAVLGEKTDCVKHILEHDINIDETDNKGMSPLKYAEKLKCEDIIRLLLQFMKS